MVDPRPIADERIVFGDVNGPGGNHVFAETDMAPQIRIGACMSENRDDAGDQRNL